MKTAKNPFIAYGLVLNVFLLSPGSFRIVNTASGGPPNNQEVLVTLYDMPGGVKSDNLEYSYDVDGNLVLTQSATNDGEYAKTDITRKVKAWMDLNNHEFHLHTWDNRTRGFYLDFSPPNGLNLGSGYVHGNIAVAINVSFLEMQVDINKSPENTEYGFATVIFPIGRDHYELQYTVAVNRVSANEWEVDSDGMATLVDFADTPRAPNKYYTVSAPLSLNVQR